MKLARFPVYRELAGFYFEQSDSEQVLVRSLYRCEFICQICLDIVYCDWDCPISGKYGRGPRAGDYHKDSAS